MNCTKNISRGCCFSRNEQGEATADSIQGSHKMEVYDWLGDIPNPQANKAIIEVQFKNTRKSFFQNETGLDLVKGDIVVVESAPGVDVGIVSLTNELVQAQMRKHRFSPQDLEFKKILRKAKPYDIEKWQEAMSLEHTTMIRARQISADMGLKMKIGDVEYQGDRLKAIFYYIADDRVDFRELIKVFAEQFRVRVEMKQIGARQEAGRIGGISACGRQLCCSTWQNSFQSVSITAARHQEISLNPQKLAGQCGKLKCCLNYEVDNYIDARKEFPYLNNPLEAMDGTYYLVKNDIFKKLMWFSPDPTNLHILIPVTIDRVRKIMSMNRKGIKVDKIEDSALIKQEVLEPEYKNVVGEESITRFDKSSGSGRPNSRNRNRNRNNEKQTADTDTRRANQNNTEAQSENGNKNENSGNGTNGQNSNGSNGQQGGSRNGNGGNRNNDRNRSRNENRNTSQTEGRRENQTEGRRENRAENSTQGENRSENGVQNENQNGNRSQSETQNGNREQGENRNRNNDRNRSRRNDKPRTENGQQQPSEKSASAEVGTSENGAEARQQTNRRNNRFRQRKPKPQE